VTDYTPRTTHYAVIAGLSEAINYPTIKEARDFANAQASTGLTVRVFAVQDDGHYFAI
jgi:hypothetical protein